MNMGVYTPLHIMYYPINNLNQSTMKMGIMWLHELRLPSYGLSESQYYIKAKYWACHNKHSLFLIHVYGITVHKICVFIFVFFFTAKRWPNWNFEEAIIWYWCSTHRRYIPLFYENVSLNLKNKKKTCDTCYDSKASFIKKFITPLTL